MGTDEGNQECRREPDVDPEEAVDRQGADAIAVLQEVEDARPEDRRVSSDVDRDARGEQGVEVPWQEVAGEPQDEREDEQDDADDPLDLARLLVGAPEQHLE